MTRLLRRLRSVALILCPALCVACTDVIEISSTDSGSSSFPFDTGRGGGTPDVGGNSKDTGASAVADVAELADDDATGDTSSPDPDIGADGPLDVTEEQDAAAPPDDTQAADAGNDAGALTCDQLEAAFDAALTQATACTGDADCDARHPSDIAACACDVWVTLAGVGALTDLTDEFVAGGCETCEPPSSCPVLGNPRCVGGFCEASTTPVSCTALADAYKAEISKAKGCTASEECRSLTEGALTCGCPLYLNENYDNTKIKSVASQFHTAMCSPGEGCPACGEPLIGVCSSGKCVTKTKAP